MTMAKGLLLYFNFGAAAYLIYELAIGAATGPGVAALAGVNIAAGFLLLLSIAGGVRQ